MKLLSYAPEVNRLRRVARACAAGELSRTEYRQARRDVIAGLVKAYGPGSDNTVPRFADDATMRRVDFPTVDQADVRRNSHWIWLVLGVALLIALAVPTIASGDEIPPVAQRPLAPSPATTYDVTALHWQVPADIADAVDDAALRALLDDALANAREVPSGHGFTPTELEQVGRYLNAIGVHEADTRLTLEDLRDLRALVEVQKERRGVSLQSLERAAQRLQAWVRAQGFPLAQAYVPAQQIEQGHVQLAVEVGRLAEINVQQEREALLASNQSLAQQLTPLRQQPVRREHVETYLNLINRVGGQSVQASFQPGAEVGTTDMQLHVQSQRRVTGALQLDNYGIDAFGREQVSYRVQTTGLFRASDVAAVAIRNGIGEGDDLLGGLDYTMPLADPRNALHANLRVADVETEDGAEGEAVITRLAWNRTGTFTRERRTEWQVQASLRDLQWDQANLPEQQVWGIRAGIDGHRIWDDSRIALEGHMSLHIGGVDETPFAEDDQYVYLRGETQAWTPLGQIRGLSARLAVGARLQLTQDVLPVTERAFVSTPTHNPGLEVGQLRADNLFELNSRMEFVVPRGQVWGYVHAAYAENNDAANTWYHLVTGGVGWSGELMQSQQGRLSGQLLLGYPFVHRSNGVLNDDGAQVFWSLRFDH